jgi:hypothetical protein
MLAFQSDEYDGPINTLDTVVNAIFFVDIILRFFTAYIDEEELEIRDTFKVRPFSHKEFQSSISNNLFCRKLLSSTFNLGFLSI